MQSAVGMVASALYSFGLCGGRFTQRVLRHHAVFSSRRVLAFHRLTLRSSGLAYSQPLTLYLGRHRNETMEAPEYLDLFSGQGSARVRVRFRSSDGKIASLAFSPREILSLIAAEGDAFHQYLRFDDYLFEVLKYEIDPKTQTLTIVAAPTQGSDSA